MTDHATLQQRLRNVMPEIADTLLSRLQELTLRSVAAQDNHDLPYFLQVGRQLVMVTLQGEETLTATTPTPDPDLPLVLAVYRARNDDMLDVSTRVPVRGELRCVALADSGDAFCASMLAHEIPAALADALDAIIEAHRLRDNNPPPERAVHDAARRNSVNTPHERAGF